jgi:glutamate N-acetyltransferase/amino-acid N-acetyltransferase
MVARSIANSPLVKTAINGEDANWGRIISSAGMSGADFNPANVEIKFGDFPVLDKNFKVVVDEDKAKQILSNNDIVLNVNLNEGDSHTEWWTCDYSEEYIKINAYYRT